MEESPERASPASRRTWVVPALCAAAYLYVFPYQPRVRSPNEEVRLYMTAALLEERSLRLDTMRARWGTRPDNDAAERDGHVYSPKAPGTSFLGVPGYALYFAGCRLADRTPALAAATWVVRATASVVPTLLWLLAFRRWLAGRTRDPLLRDAVFVAVALGSPVYGYALLFTSHAQAAGAAFGAFAILREARLRGAVSGAMAFAAGLLAASVTLFEYPGFIASVALTGYALVCLKPRVRLAPFALGALLPTIAMMVFQYGAFGNALTPGHRMSINAQYRAELHQGPYGATGFSLRAAASLLFDPGFGLLALTPVLLLSPLGLARAWRRGERPEVITLAAICGGTVAAIASMNNWRGGWTVGARYLCTLVPLLAWSALDGLDGLARRHRRAAASIALGTTAAAFAAAGSVSAYYPYVPPEITRPVTQLVAVLARDGFAPYTAASLVGVHGTASIAPLLGLALAALAWLARDVASAERLRVVVGAWVVGASCLAPALWPVAVDESAREAVAFVARSWSPARHDRAAVLERRMDEAAAPAPEDCRALERVYRSEGRDREASFTARRCQGARARRAPTATRGWPFQ